MMDFHEYLKDVFFNLNARIQKMNTAREKKGLSTLGEGEAVLLGRMSLLVRSELAESLGMSESLSVDALLKMHHSIKLELQAVLDEAGLLFDPELEPGWFPEDAVFEELYTFGGVEVKNIDAESALVSLAVQSPEGNKELVARALALGLFPALADRIRSSGGTPPA